MKSEVESQWTERGHRLRVNIDTGFLLLTCEAKVILADGKPGVWRRSQLGIYQCVPKQEVERAVRHWLSFYEDEALIEAGREAVANLFSEGLSQIVRVN